MATILAFVAVMLPNQVLFAATMDRARGQSGDTISVGSGDPETEAGSRPCVNLIDGGDSIDAEASSVAAECPIELLDDLSSVNLDGGAMEEDSSIGSPPLGELEADQLQVETGAAEPPEQPEPTPTPVLEATASPTPTETPTPVSTPTATASPSLATDSPTPTATSLPTATATVIVADTQTPPATPLPSLTPTATVELTQAPTPTSTPVVLTTPTPTLAPASVTVRMTDFAFTATNAPFAGGGSVTWTNQGQAPHTATKLGAGGFDTGTADPGGSKTLTFATAGTFAYVCVLHPTLMSGTVIVQA
ncbi:MAG: hypothetical protein EXR58_07805 [Chloroflexi bacterium]|nr:hypothetical protein [Chloroflexota bacterium]